MATLKKIKVNLEYEGRIISSQVPPYKTLNYLKELAKNVFYLTNSEIQMIYSHKDITQFDNYIIGDFFKRKNPISIKINTLIINSKSTNDIRKKRKYKLDKANFLCSCNRDLIANYCRNCKMFICNSCRINQIHIKHKVTQVDTDNLVESVKLYALTLQNDISLNIKKTQDNIEKLENNDNKDDISNRHELIKQKFDTIFNIYSDCINNLNNNNNIEQVVIDYKNQTDNTNIEIEKTLQKIYNKYTKGRKEMTQDDFIKYFKLLSEKEDDLQNQSNDIISLRVNDDIKERMKLIYDKIEQILDFTLNAKNTLGVSSETDYLFNLVLKNKKEKEEINNEENDNNNNENTNNNEENENEDNDSDNNNEENEEEKRKLNNIIDKNQLQKEEKNNLITMGVLDGNNTNEDNNNSSGYYSENQE